MVAQSMRSHLRDPASHTSTGWSGRKGARINQTGGLLLIEDFAFGETDARTLRWFLEILRSDKARLNVLPVEGQFVTDLLSAKDPTKAWHENHNRALHSITALVSAISKRFVIRETESVPYLYRYLVPVLPQTTTATAFVEQLLNEEAHLGKEGSILLMGRRIVATPK